MAIDLWWLGDATETTARICLRSTTDGTPVVTCNGNTFTGSAIVAATNDGTGLVEVTGLVADTSNSFTLTIDGASESGTLKTMPEAGSDFTFMWGSCFLQDTWQSHANWLKGVVDKYDPVCFLHQGDISYYDRTMDYSHMTAFGGNEPADSELNFDDQDNAYKWCRYNFHNPLWKHIMHKVPFYWMGDDHEILNDFSMYKAHITSVFDAVYTDRYRDSILMYRAYNGANRNYMIGNPSNTDAGIDAVELNPASYWRKTIGDVEIFQGDAISYRHDYAMADSAAKKMLFDTQETWLSNKVASSTAVFKCLSMSKTLFEGGPDGLSGSGNADTYMDFPDERDRLIDDLSGTDTTVWLSGDKHSPHAFKAPAGTYTDDLLDVMASPIASDPFHDPLGAASGTTDGVSASRLIDSTKEFNDRGVTTTTIAFNMVSGATANVLGLATTTNPNDTVVLDADIFVSGEDYELLEPHDLYNEYIAQSTSHGLTTRYFCVGLVEVYGSADVPYIVVSIVNAMGNKMMSWRLEQGSNTPVANVSKIGM